MRLQLVLLLVVGLWALLPPAHGEMLIVPVAAPGEGATVRWALSAGARLIGPGPIRGSWLVAGDAGRLIPAALTHGALLLDARVAGCAGTGRSVE